MAAHLDPITGLILGSSPRTVMTDWKCMEFPLIAGIALDNGPSRQYVVLTLSREGGASRMVAEGVRQGGARRAALTIAVREAGLHSRRSHGASQRLCLPEGDHRNLSGPISERR